MSKDPIAPPFWKSAPAFLLYCLLIFAALLWAANHFRNFAADYDGEGMTGEIVNRGSMMTGRGALARTTVKFADGTTRQLPMTTEQWGTCYEGAQVTVKEIDGTLFLTTDGCLPVEDSKE